MQLCSSDHNGHFFWEIDCSFVDILLYKKYGKNHDRVVDKLPTWPTNAISTGVAISTGKMYILATDLRHNAPATADV